MLNNISNTPLNICVHDLLKRIYIDALCKVSMAYILVTAINLTGKSI